MRSGIFGVFVFIALAVSPGASGGQAIIQELRARTLGEQHSLGAEDLTLTAGTKELDENLGMFADLVGRQ